MSARSILDRTFSYHTSINVYQKDEQVKVIDSQAGMYQDSVTWSSCWGILQPTHASTDTHRDMNLNHGAGSHVN